MAPLENSILTSSIETFEILTKENGSVFYWNRDDTPQGALKGRNWHEEGYLGRTVEMNK